MSKDNFSNSEHAMFAGATVGYLTNKGIVSEPNTDDDGDYTDVITIKITFGVSDYWVNIKVLPMIVPVETKEPDAD